MLRPPGPAGRTAATQAPNVFVQALTGRETDAREVVLSRLTLTPERTLRDSSTKSRERETLEVFPEGTALPGRTVAPMALSGMTAGKLEWARR
ncbi:MAG: hypothetical protein HY724_08340 [Candidatus Rokubacteria bacterium]|nr:hypothetical protein [Candidatus Rokubacteria bacterium]